MLKFSIYPFQHSQWKCSNTTKSVLESQQEWTNYVHGWNMDSTVGTNVQMPNTKFAIYVLSKLLFPLLFSIQTNTSHICLIRVGLIPCEWSYELMVTPYTTACVMSSPDWPTCYDLGWTFINYSFFFSSSVQNFLSNWAISHMCIHSHQVITRSEMRVLHTNILKTSGNKILKKIINMLYYCYLS